MISIRSTGVLHLDQYTIQIEGLEPHGRSRLPGWTKAYFVMRFDAYPWYLTYLKQSRDGEFWRKRSLRFHPERMPEIPMYLIGGLLDGYRDSVPRMLDAAKAPVTAVMGPWNHSFPDNAEPGPGFEWRRELVRWWNRWLRPGESAVAPAADIAVFVRGGHAPDAAMTTTPGG